MKPSLSPSSRLSFLWRSRARRESLPFILPSLLATLLLYRRPRLAVFPAGLTLFFSYFFRDPDRSIPSEEGAVLAPADGRVKYVSQTRRDGTPGSRIAIFLSVFDVHVNRSPLAGTVQTIAYSPGRFLAANFDRADRLNEQNTVVLETPYGAIGVRQVAGLLARRIVCWARNGLPLAAGERFGLIRFGSSTVLELPPTATVTTVPGDRVRGGETIVARFL